MKKQKQQFQLFIYTTCIWISFCVFLFKIIFIHNFKLKKSIVPFVSSVHLSQTRSGVLCVCVAHHWTFSSCAVSSFLHVSHFVQTFQLAVLYFESLLLQFSLLNSSFFGVESRMYINVVYEFCVLKWIMVVKFPFHFVWSVQHHLCNVFLKSTATNSQQPQIVKCEIRKSFAITTHIHRHRETILQKILYSSENRYDFEFLVLLLFRHNGFLLCVCVFDLDDKRSIIWFCYDNNLYCGSIMRM